MWPNHAPAVRCLGQILRREGARAMLDQLPTITPIASATANQNKVDPPNRINPKRGNKVVPLV